MKTLVFLFLIGFLDCFVFYQNGDSSEAVLSSNLPDDIQPKIRGVQNVNVTFCPRDVAIIDSHLLMNVNDSVVYRIDATSCQKSIFGWQPTYPITGYQIKVYRGELNSGSLFSGTINGNLSSTLITVQITMTSSPNTTFPAIFITTDPNTTTIYPSISRSCYSGSSTNFPLSLNNLPNLSIVVYRGEIDASDATPGLWGLRINTTNLNFKGKIYRGISLDTSDLIYGGNATCSLNPPMDTIPEHIFDEFITLQLDGQPPAQMMSYYCAKQAQFNTAYTVDTNPKTLMMPSSIDGSSNVDYTFTIKDLPVLPDQALQIDVYNVIPTQANLSILFYNYAQEKNTMLSFTNSSQICQIELPTSNMTVSYKRQACQSNCAPALFLRLQQVPATLNIQTENITFCPRDFAILDNSKLIRVLDSIVYRIDATSCQKNIYGWLPPYPIVGYSFKFYQGELSTGKLIDGPINGNLNSSLITVQITKTADPITTFPAILLTTDFTTTTVYPPNASLCYSGAAISVPLSLPGVPNPSIVVYRGEINLSEATPGLWGLRINTTNFNFKGKIYRGISLFGPDLIYGGNATCSLNPPMDTIPEHIFDEFITLQLDGQPPAQMMSYYCAKQSQFTTAYTVDTNPKTLMMPSSIDGSSNVDYTFTIKDLPVLPDQALQIDFYNGIPTQANLSILFYNYAQEKNAMLSFTNSSQVCQIELPTSNMTVSYKRPACQSNCAPALLLRLQQVSATLNIQTENITFCPRDFAILDNSKLIRVLDSIVYRIDATSCQKNIYGWLPPYPIVGYSFKFYQGELSTGKLIDGPINGNLNSSLITVQITKTADPITTFPAILLTTDFTTTTVYPPNASLCYSGAAISVPLSLPGVPNPSIVVYRGEINLSEATPGLWALEVDPRVEIKGNVYRGISLFAPDLIYGGNSTCSDNPPMNILPLQIFDDYMTIQLNGQPSNQSLQYRCTRKTQFNTKSFFDQRPAVLMMPSFIDGSPTSFYNFSIATTTTSIGQVVQVGFYNQIPTQGHLSIAYFDAASQNLTTLSYTNSSNVCQLELPTANLTVSYQWPACRSNCAPPLLIRVQQVLPIATTTKGAPSMRNGALIFLLFCLPLLFK